MVLKILISIGNHMNSNVFDELCIRRKVIAQGKDEYLSLHNKCPKMYSNSCERIITLIIQGQMYNKVCL